MDLRTEETTPTTLTEDADVVVIDESLATSFLNENAGYTTLRKLWQMNKILLFINPGTQACSLREKLSSLLGETNMKSPADEILSILEGVNVFGVRADGTMIMHERVGGGTAMSIYATVTGETEEGVKTESYIPEKAEYIPTDYEKGVLAENVAKWLNHNALLGIQKNIAFVRSGSEYNVVPTTLTRHYSLTFLHFC